MGLLQTGLIITVVIFIISTDVTLGCPRPPPRQPPRCSMALPKERKVAEHMAIKFDSRYMCFTLKQLCSYICFTDWSRWSDCTKPCGGGSQYRTRSRQYVGGCRGTSHTCVESGYRQTRWCKQGCPNGGYPSSTGCSCSPAYKGRCCKEEVTCRYPERPNNGQVQVRSPIRYGEVAKYTCNEGYHLYGSETSTCSTDGKWSTSKPECEAIMCPMIVPETPMVILNPESNKYGDTIFYECPRGYLLNGTAPRTCIKRSGSFGKWDPEEEPTCERVICPPLSAPLNGTMNGSSFLYGDKVIFQCNPRYQLVGSSSLRCTSAGTWMGNVPTCEAISCDSPDVPKHGSIIMLSKNDSTFGAEVMYECEEGYILQGNKSLKCMEDGEWNGTAPVCKAVLCGDPGVPDNGGKDGSVYFYPHKVIYSCHHGYELIGEKEIACQTNSNWTSPKPECIACEKDFYMDNLEKPGECQECPDNTHTVTNASTSKRQCLCDSGYDGPPGGPCTEIMCHELFAPQPRGVMESCDNKVNSQCQFGCIDGVIISKGSSVRTCQESGEWDGNPPQCTACPIDTYKSTNRSCLPCPANSGTEKTGSTLEDCVCTTGYSGPGGGPCEDIDECMANNGTGPCEDTCENQEGSYACRCTRPGYELKEDEHTCYATQDCRNLTKEDAPDNGGLVCHWYRKESSQQCSVMCNDGYEFAERTNNYETCGPSTGYKWTYKTTNPKAVIAPCLEEFFPGVRMESDAAYFTTACDELTEKDELEVYKNFKERLDNASVCMTRKSKVCSIEDMSIVCGKRSKRDIGDGKMQVVDEVDLLFKVKSLKLAVSPKDDCKSNICRMLKIPDKHCIVSVCVSSYKRYIKAAVLYAKKQLKILFKNKEKRNKLQFNAGSRQFLPQNKIINLGGVEVECPLGMAANKDLDKCIPCDAGTFWNSTSTNCDPCPVGMYQPFKNMTLCLKCPPGTQSSQPMAILCDVCPPGFYGEECKQKCACVNGTCNPENGTCECKPGFEGKYCEEDIDGCADVNCYPGVPCIDAPAPATGSSCGPCPPGLAGDGAVCQRTEL